MTKHSTTQPPRDARPQKAIPRTVQEEVLRALSRAAPAYTPAEHKKAAARMTRDLSEPEAREPERRRGNPASPRPRSPHPPRPGRNEASPTKNDEQ